MKTDRQLDGVYEVVYKSGRFLVRKVDENTSQKTVQDAGLFIALLSPGAKLEYVRFPMRVGSSWTTSYVFRPAAKKRGPVCNREYEGVRVWLFCNSR
jgi:hypothetical protein